MKKKIGYTLLVLLIIIIILSFIVEKIPHNFYMQFDTGSPYSFIYENDLNSLREIGLDIKEVIKNETRYVEHLDIMLDDNHIEVSMIKILENYGHTFNKNDTINQIGIGSIGSDFIVNRITSIDFKNQNIHFFNDRTQLMKKLPAFKPFSFTGRRIMLPAIIDDKEYEFIYDSGCSAFGLITIKNRFEKYSDENTEEVTYDAKSWNDKIPIKSKLTDKPFNIGNADLTLKRVSYVDMYTAMQPIITPFTRVGGWLGNQPFNESILILDTKTEEFIITKE